MELSNLSSVILQRTVKLDFVSSLIFFAMLGSWPNVLHPLFQPNLIRVEEADVLMEVSFYLERDQISGKIRLLKTPDPNPI